MRRYLPFLIVGFVAVATVSAGVMLYRSHRPVVLTIPKESQLNSETKSAHARGPANAPVTLEEFGDFQCPPCGGLASPLKQIEEENGKQLRVIFRHFPFAIHQHAMHASLAAEAAGMQNRFWEMHDLLYREQGTWSKAVDVGPLFDSYAGILGLDVERFKKDMQTEQVKARVDQDQKRGTSLGVNTTPTIFINNRAVPPTSLSPDGLRKAIKEAMSSKSSG